MHIGFLTPEYPHARTGNSGGIGTSIANLATGLVNAGHKISVLVYGQNGDDRFEDGGIAIHRIKNTKLKGFSRWLTQKKIQRLINALVKDEKLELVEAPDWTGITSRIRLKCPVVVKLNGSDTYFCHIDGRKVKPINRMREERALKNADALASVSRFTAQVTGELFGIKREFTIIHNSIDPQKFNISDVPETPETLLYFGTLIRKKGLLELPLIFNEVVLKNPDAKLILVGKDSADISTGSPSTWQLMRPLFSAQAYRNATWLGPVDHAQMQNHIATACVCVFPTFAEALPVSWIEAMAMGKAIVASDIGWAEEVVENGTDGFLADPKKHGEFAARIHELLSDANLRIKLAKAAREKAVSRFSIAAIAAQNEEFYLKVIRDYNR